MAKKSKTISHIICISWLNFSFATFSFLLMIIIGMTLRGNFIGWYPSIFVSTCLFVSLFFLYHLENPKISYKASYTYFALIVLCGVIFWDEITGLWQSTPNEIQTSVVNKSWDLIDIIVGAVIGSFITAYITVQMMKKHFSKSETK